MGQRVIEPSEIITGQEDVTPNRPSHSNPWLRLFARFFDYSLFFMIIRLMGAPVTKFPLSHIIPMEFFAWIPIETLFLATLGTTPGKWVLGTEIKKGHLKRLPFTCALRRSFMVWFRGMGLGIPVINALCMLSAFYRLRVFASTSWDRDEGIHVIHHPIGKWRIYLAVAVTALISIYYSFWKKSWF